MAMTETRQELFQIDPRTIRPGRAYYHPQFFSSIPVAQLEQGFDGWYSPIPMDTSSTSIERMLKRLRWQRQALEDESGSNPAPRQPVIWGPRVEVNQGTCIRLLPASSMAVWVQLDPGIIITGWHQETQTWELLQNN